MSLSGKCIKMSTKTAKRDERKRERPVFFQLEENAHAQSLNTGNKKEQKEWKREKDSNTREEQSKTFVCSCPKAIKEQEELELLLLLARYCDLVLSSSLSFFPSILRYLFPPFVLAKNTTGGQYRTKNFLQIRVWSHRVEVIITQFLLNKIKLN